MKRPVARRRLRAVGVIASALACTAALAQVVNPSLPGQSVMPGQGIAPGNQTLPAPTLLTPVADLQIRTPIASTHSQAFSWSPPRNAPVPERYVLCAALSPSADCNGDSNAERVVVETPSTMTQYLTSLPSAFNDKVIYWTVAACGAGYGGANVSTALNPGGRYARCTWAPRRKLDATPRAPAPNLAAPANSHTTTGDRQEFTWDPIPEASAYRFCLADDLRDCQTQSLSGDRGVITRVPAGTRIQVDLAPLRRPPGTRNMVWTVFPCFAAPCVNTAQPVSRVVTIGPPPPRLPPPSALTGDPASGTPPVLLPRAGSYNNSVAFSWNGPSEATSYNFCIARQNGACGSGDSYVTNVSGPARSGISIPYSALSRFAGEVMSWTVASCDAEKRCGDYKTPPGSFLVARLPERTRLNRPISGGTVHTQPNAPLDLHWYANPLAQSYTVKVNGVEFPAGPNFSCMLRMTGSVNNPGQPEGTVRWSVKACNAAGCTEGEEWELRFRTPDYSPSPAGAVVGGVCGGGDPGVGVRQGR
jgi:hypothetical protein